jgi:hypothetical protein
MRAYRVAWLGFCGVVGVAGALAAFTWSLATVALLFVLTALTGGTAAMIALTPADNTTIDRDRWPLVATSAVVAGAGSVAFIGLGTLLGAPMAMLVLVLTVGGSPYVARRWIGWLRDHEQPPVPENPGEPESMPISVAAVRELESVDAPEVEAGELSDDALCLAWRASFSALERAESHAERLRIVEARHTYLDELERRNPPGVAAWLASGARAAGNPTKFVLGDGTSNRATIDWDGLIQGTDK